MKKKATKGKVKSGRKRSAAKDLSARKASAVKGGLLPAVRVGSANNLLGDGSVRPANLAVKISNF